MYKLIYNKNTSHLHITYLHLTFILINLKQCLHIKVSNPIYIENVQNYLYIILYILLYNIRLYWLFYFNTYT